MRGTDPDAATKRLEDVFDSGDPQLLERFRTLAADHLEVIVGDIGEPNLGLDQSTWERLAQSVDLIVHPAALVNHVLPYDQLFGPNVVGTAELIRLAITDADQAGHLPVDRLGRHVGRPRQDSPKTAISAPSARCAPSTTATPTDTGTASGAARFCFARHTTCAGCRSRSSDPT